MKVILFAAMSINGLLANNKGSEDFLSDANWQVFSQLAKKSGCIIIGRNTFELVQKWPEYNFDGISAKLKIVVSHKKDLKLKLPYLLVKSPAEALKKAALFKMKTVVVAGGSMINSAFVKKNLVDELILNLEPALIGSGVPIFATDNFEKRLSLKKIKKIDRNIIQLQYNFIKTTK